MQFAHIKSGQAPVSHFVLLWADAVLSTLLFQLLLVDFEQTTDAFQCVEFVQTIINRCKEPTWFTSF